MSLPPCWRPSRTEAPSLRRRYPVSPVLRASPSPRQPRLVLAVSRLARARHRRGFPCCCCLPLHACRRQYPGGTGRCSRRSLPDRCQPSPYYRRVGFRIARFEACSAFTHVAACVLAESPSGDPSSSECFSAFRYLPAPLRLLPAGATVAGRDSHPLGHSAFPRRTIKARLV